MRRPLIQYKAESVLHDQQILIHMVYLVFIHFFLWFIRYKWFSTGFALVLPRIIYPRWLSIISLTLDGQFWNKKVNIIHRKCVMLFDTPPPSCRVIYIHFLKECMISNISLQIVMHTLSKKWLTPTYLSEHWAASCDRWIAGWDDDIHLSGIFLLRV